MVGKRRPTERTRAKPIDGKWAGEREKIEEEGFLWTGAGVG